VGLLSEFQVKIWENIGNSMNKNDLIHKLGNEVLMSEDLSDNDWVSLSLVIELAEGVYSESGYLYCNDEVKPFSVETDDPLAMRHISKELSVSIKKESNSDVVQILVQIRQKDLKVKIDFEYENKSRWSITPSNMQQMKENLRPVFD